VNIYNFIDIIPTSFFQIDIVVYLVQRYVIRGFINWNNYILVLLQVSGIGMYLSVSDKYED